MSLAVGWVDSVERLIYAYMSVHYKTLFGFSKKWKREVLIKRRGMSEDYRVFEGMSSEVVDGSSDRALVRRDGKAGPHLLFSRDSLAGHISVGFSEIHYCMHSISTVRTLA